MADNLATFMCRLSTNFGSLNLLDRYGPVQARTGKALPLPSLQNGVIYTTFRVCKKEMFTARNSGGYKGTSGGSPEGCKVIQCTLRKFVYLHNERLVTSVVLCNK
jgi:hypothetical protein